MRILVLGAAGKIGSALLKDLIRSNDVTEIVAADLSMKTLNQVVQKLGSEKIQTIHINASNQIKLKELIQNGFDAITSALFGELQLTTIKVAIEAGVHYVDVGVGSPKVFEMNEAAKAAGIAVIPNLGLDPGIDCICQGYAVSRLDRVDALKLWCGGIPPKDQKDDNPLSYKVSWAWHHTIGTYRGKAKIIRDGELIEVDKFEPPENPEIVTFPGLGECEAFFAGASFDLIEHLNLTDLKDAWNKSVRWPGHCNIWRTLIALHMTDLDPVQIKLRVKPSTTAGQMFDSEYLDQPIEINPLEFLTALGEKHFRYKEGEGDVVVLRTEVMGEKNGQKMTIGHEMVDFYDPELKVTSMGRNTAYPCSIVAQMLVKGDIQDRGVIHTGKLGLNQKFAKIFFDELAKRNIHLIETVSQPL